MEGKGWQRNGKYSWFLQQNTWVLQDLFGTRSRKGDLADWTLEIALKYRFFQTKLVWVFLGINLTWCVKEKQYSCSFVIKLFAGVLPAEPLSDPKFSNWVFREKVKYLPFPGNCSWTETFRITVILHPSFPQQLVNKGNCTSSCSVPVIHSFHTMCAMESTHLLHRKGPQK